MIGSRGTLSKAQGDLETMTISSDEEGSVIIVEKEAARSTATGGESGGNQGFAHSNGRDPRAGSTKRPPPSRTSSFSSLYANPGHLSDCESFELEETPPTSRSPSVFIQPVIQSKGKSVAKQDSEMIIVPDSADEADDEPPRPDPPRKRKASKLQGLFFAGKPFVRTAAKTPGTIRGDQDRSPTLRPASPVFESDTNKAVPIASTSRVPHSKSVPSASTSAARTSFDLLNGRLVYPENRLGELLEGDENEKKSKPRRRLSEVAVSLKPRKNGPQDLTEGFRALFDKTRRAGAIITGIAASVLIMHDDGDSADSDATDTYATTIAGEVVMRVSVDQVDEAEGGTLKEMKLRFTMETREAMYEIHLDEVSGQDALLMLDFAELVERNSFRSGANLASELAKLLGPFGATPRHSNPSTPLTPDLLTPSRLAWLNELASNRTYLSSISFLLHKCPLHSIRTEPGVEQKPIQEVDDIREVHDSLLLKDTPCLLPPVDGVDSETMDLERGDSVEAIRDGLRLKVGDFVVVRGRPEKGVVGLEEVREEVWYGVISGFAVEMVHIHWFLTAENTNQAGMRAVSCRELFEQDGCDSVSISTILCRTDIAYLDADTTAIPPTELFCRFRRPSGGVTYRDATRIPVHSTTCPDHLPSQLLSPPTIYAPGTHVYILAEQGGSDQNRVKYRPARVLEYVEDDGVYEIEWLIRRDDLPSDSEFRCGRRLVSTGLKGTVKSKEVQGSVLVFSYAKLFSRFDMKDRAVRDKALVQLSKCPDVFYHEGEFGEMVSKNRVESWVVSRCSGSIVVDDDKWEEWVQARAKERMNRLAVAGTVGRKIKVVELYSGISGFGQGAQEVLGTVSDFPLSLEEYPLYALDIVCIDSHRTTTKVLEENFGNRPGFTSVCGRIDRINEAELHRRNQLSESEELAEIENDPPLQFVFGGPPCQSFSKNNFFKVDNDRRSFEPAVFLDHLRIYRPIAGIFENVSAIEDFVDADGQSLLLSFEAILRSMGYQMLCAHYNCASSGVPQRRRRLIICFSLIGTALPSTPVWTHSYSDERLVPKFRDDWLRREVASSAIRGSAPHLTTGAGVALSDLPQFGNVGGWKDPVGYRTGPMTDYQRYIRSQNTVDSVSDHQSTSHDEKGRRRIERIPENGNYDDLPAHLRPNSKRINKDLLGRADIDKPISTVLTQVNTAGANQGRKLHYKQDRLFSNRELARAQGFPDSFQFSAARAKEDVTRMIGNAVPPPFIAGFIRQWLLTFDAPGFSFEIGFAIRRKLLIEEMKSRRASGKERLARLEEEATLREAEKEAARLTEVEATLRGVEKEAARLVKVEAARAEGLRLREQRSRVIFAGYDSDMEI